MPLTDRSRASRAKDEPSWTFTSAQLIGSDERPGVLTVEFEVWGVEAENLRRWLFENSEPLLPVEEKYGPDGQVAHARFGEGLARDIMVARARLREYDDLVERAADWHEKTRAKGVDEDTADAFRNVRRCEYLQSACIGVVDALEAEMVEYVLRAVGRLTRYQRVKDLPAGFAPCAVEVGGFYFVVGPDEGGTGSTPVLTAVESEAVDNPDFTTFAEGWDAR